MNYQDVIKDSKFYLPMNLNLGYLLKDAEILILMNVINCDNIHVKLSVRKLMRYTNRSNNTVQNALKGLRNLKLIEGFVPKYDTLKHVFDSLNNAKSIEERIKWCEVYQNSIQNNVSETDTENVSKTGTQIKKIEKENLNKKNMNISHNILKEEEIEKQAQTNEYFEKFTMSVDKELVGEDEDELLFKRVELSTELSRNRASISSTLYSRCHAYLNRKYEEAVASM